VKAITQATIIFLSIGTVSGLLILYDYLETPHIISKDQAVAIAIKSFGLTQQDLVNITIKAELLQPLGPSGNNPTTSIDVVINDTTMSRDPFPRLDTNPFIDPHETKKFFWVIKIGKQVGRSEYRSCQSLIDATNGTILHNEGNC
jgi:hypothetical protein